MYNYIIEQDNNNSYYNLIFMFIVLLMMVIFLYISYVLSTRQDNKLSISKADFDLFQQKSKLPDLDDNKKISIPYKERATLYNFSKLRTCPNGNCVLDLESGTKRCPNNNNTKLSYYPEYESCTESNSCDDSRLPFAEKPDGSAINNSCGASFPCRCLEKPQCAYQITSTFNQIGGNFYGVNKNQLNYSFSIDNQNQFVTKNPIIYEREELGEKFCKINPGFTNRINNGCKLINNINDPIDCNSSNAYTLIPEKNNNSYLLPPNYDSFQGPTLLGKFSNYSKGQNEMYVYNIEKDIKDFGLFEITNEGISYNIFYKKSFFTNFYNEYNYTTGGADKSADQDTYPVYILTDIISQEKNEDIWSNGFPFNYIFEGKVGSAIDVSLKAPPLIPIKIIYSNCTNNISEVNYKDMLLCTQPNIQPCKTGTLTYNIDKKLNTNSIYDSDNSRNFCHAYNSNRLDVTKTNKYYLNDTSFLHKVV